LAVKKTGTEMARKKAPLADETLSGVEVERVDYSVGPSALSITRGAAAAGGEKLFCGGRYSGELKRRSTSRGCIAPGGGVMDWPAGWP